MSYNDEGLTVFIAEVKEELMQLGLILGVERATGLVG